MASIACSLGVCVLCVRPRRPNADLGISPGDVWTAEEEGDDDWVLAL